MKREQARALLPAGCINAVPRAQSELVEVNCSALPETLAESELFGHERGAFTDARTARMGLFEAACGGTLLLDEIPSLSMPLQAKVLTAIEDRRIRRVGGNKTIQVDVRMIAAANCDVKELVATGRFREDLFHRLDLYRIVIPAFAGARGGHPQASRTFQQADLPEAPSGAEASFRGRAAAFAFLFLAGKRARAGPRIGATALCLNLALI